MPAIGRLRYLEAMPPAGERPRGVVVLLHAFPLNARLWEGQLALAEGGWRVRPAFPRRRRRGGDPPTTTIDDYAGDVIDLMDALHLKQAVIGGLSMGGYAAFAVLRHAASYFQGLILADTRPQADTPQGVEGRRKMLALVEAKGAEAVADEMIPKLLGDTTRAQRPEVAARVRSLILSNSAESIAGAVRALMSRPDSTPLLSTIHVPTLIVVGDEDTLTPPADAPDARRHRRLGGWP
jgi:pimeloyl-ACP methyl ester carboxylesterase